ALPLSGRLQRVVEVAGDAVHLGQVDERAGPALPVAELREVGQRRGDVVGGAGGRADVAVDGAEVAAHQGDGPPVADPLRAHQARLLDPQVVLVVPELAERLQLYVGW